MTVGNADVDAQHLAEQLRRVLRAMAGIVARPAIAEPDVEIPVRTERQVAAVVIRERLIDERGTATRPSADRTASPASATTGSRRPPESRDDGVAVRVREVDEEAAAAGVVGRERQPEQPLLPA